MTNNFKLLFGLTLALAFALGLAFPGAVGASSDVTPADVSGSLVPSGPIAAPQLPGLDSGSIGAVAPAPDLSAADALISPEGWDAVVKLNERIEPHLFVDADGLVQLGDVTAEELGVTEEFLANYREALTYSNQAIEAGHIEVSDDLRVTTTGDLSGGDVSPVSPAKGVSPFGAESNAGGALPEWGAWGYPSGAIFYNSHSDWTYYRYSYYGICNTMAAYLGYPWMSRSLVYMYGYNQPYFSRYVYNPAGVYWYMPYSYCQTGFGYKPAYFWTRAYVYSYHCGCYQYQWAWQGFWTRY